jgi:hypothetical protein
MQVETGWLKNLRCDRCGSAEVVQVLAGQEEVRDPVTKTLLQAGRPARGWCRACILVQNRSSA